MLRRSCGFGKNIPHRTTFNRFINSVAGHPDLIEDILAQLTEQLKGEGHLPGLGEVVAVDSTTFRTHANPNKRPLRDAQASWTAKDNGKSKEGKDWYFGYKFHLLVDARHGVPITGFTTTAKENDTKFLGALMDKAEGLHGWFRPGFVLADKGYDSASNHKDVMRREALPIIPAPGARRSDCPRGSVPHGRDTYLHGDGGHGVHQERQGTRASVPMQAGGLPAKGSPRREVLRGPRVVPPDREPTDPGADLQGEQAVEGGIWSQAVGRAGVQVGERVAQA